MGNWDNLIYIIHCTCTPQLIHILEYTLPSLFFNLRKREPSVVTRIILVRLLFLVVQMALKLCMEHQICLAEWRTSLRYTYDASTSEYRENLTACLYVTQKCWKMLVYEACKPSRSGLKALPAAANVATGQLSVRNWSQWNGVGMIEAMVKVNETMCI